MDETLSHYAHRLKAADRKRLAQLPPEVAHQEATAVLNAADWRVKDEAQLAWPGDLADDDDALWFGSDTANEELAGGE